MNEQIYEEAMRSIFRQGGWSRFVHEFVGITEGDEGAARLLSFLFHMAVRVNTRKHKAGPASRWFYCKREMVERITDMGSQKQYRHLRRLRELGFLKLKMSGMPQKRYIKLDIVAIAEKLNAWRTSRHE